MRLVFSAPLLIGFVLYGGLVSQVFGQAPKTWQQYSDLAAADIKLARDTQDIAQYQQAQDAVHQLLQLSPGNFDGQKLQAAVLLGKHEFAAALKLAAELNRKVPDDVAGWSLLVDINTATGNYTEAERDAQWILDLRPGSALGFEKAAGLRELFGDAEGAMEFYQETNRRTSPNDSAQHAWLLTQIARLLLTQGNVKQAQVALDQALVLFPASQLAAGVQADIRSAEGKSTEAAALREKIYQKVSSTANLYAWAEALEKAGAREQAAKAFNDFEVRALAETNAPYNSNRSLIDFYTGYKRNPVEALKLAQKEEAIRQDEGTLAASAWAFYNNDKNAEARVRMDRALAVGVRNPLYFCHAAQIAAKSNDAVAVAKYQKELAGFTQNACAANLPVQTAKEVIK